ncbi:hypothetical protein N0V84_011869 [Fusarium piperis]|uniref:Uncharacterized protein n=1 Tax=Fusarium piperis TaxID=1435070 RepID=A0A9W8T9P8_9HYPO|nr:hypothetical protein N0V84_011869 [Fusarium piperis]
MGVLANLQSRFQDRDPEAFRLRDFKNHFSSAFSCFYLCKIFASGKSYETLVAVHRKHDCIGPNELMTDDTDLIKAMGPARSNWVRYDWYSSGRVHPVDDTILNVVDTLTHDILRHDLVPGYSGRKNRSLEGDVDGQLVNLIALIRQKYISTKEKTLTLEFVKLPQYFTVDTTTQICFGKPFRLPRLRL